MDEYRRFGGTRFLRLQSTRVRIVGKISEDLLKSTPGPGAHRWPWRRFCECSGYLQASGDSGEKVNVLWSDCIGHCEKKITFEHASNSDWLPR